MKLLWSLIAKFYTALVNSGYKIAPPKFLFNQPEYKVFSCETKEIHADITFTEEERSIILQAAKDLSFFSNDAFAFNIIFDLDADRIDDFLSDNVMLRAFADNENVIASDNIHKNFTVGLCRYWDDGTRDLYLVCDRIRTPSEWRRVTIHELGHFIDLSHTKLNSIMHSMCSAKVLYPTRIDAEEFAKVYGCKVDDLRYFKL